ncbi:MAG: methylated-DNA--[protein]-cysteine S-methyltransferase [Synergistaceae bacterium]|nr:methylated-DNA--[protein]-cysteine S-methyltransferase [Synergistaceae bacterium]
MQTLQNAKRNLRSSASQPVVFYYETEIGEIAISELNGKIVSLFFSRSRVPKFEVELPESEVLKEARAQLEAYLKGKLRIFSLPLAPLGTEFQMSVWKALCDIPYGTTASYSEIAERINNPKACRAVGNANNKNPISIFIPCHRVIAKDGKLSGYGGGISIKERLLRLEGVLI